MVSSNNSTDVRAPIFLFGFDRSGTTLLSMIVGAHPRIAVPFSTTGLWYRYGCQLEKYHRLQSQDDLGQIINDLLAEERIRLWDVEFDRNSLLDGLKTGDFPQVVERFHQEYARLKGKDLWGNIDIATIDDMDMANAWFPTARFVHIVRDGRDVALSHQTMPYGAGNIAECAEKWVHRLHTNLKMGNILGEDRYLVVRYEDLILELEPSLQRLCQFIGVDYHPQMTQYHTMVSEKVPDHRRWLWPAISKPLVKSNVYRWKSEMSVTQRIVFEKQAHAMLKKLDYEVYDKIPRSLGTPFLELWYFLEQGHRLTRFAARLGFKRKSKLERQWAHIAKDKPSNPNARSQAEAFGSLVEEGVYNIDFTHSKSAQAFFLETISKALKPDGRTKPLSILECGCGTGAWLDYLKRIVLKDTEGRHRYYGFDVTPAMVDLARKKLAKHISPQNIRVGDILNPSSFDFEAPSQRFDLIYAYDVIQQLPRKMQFLACQTVWRRLTPGGVAVLFDHDQHSPYGRSMAWKKFATRYLGLHMVPDYYCNAKYPPLEKFLDRFQATGGVDAKIYVASDGKKRALIIHAGVTS